jgi:hypothetical protein
VITFLFLTSKSPYKGGIGVTLQWLVILPSTSVARLIGALVRPALIGQGGCGPLRAPLVG